ncbi:uncharacterized protein A1O5_07010 [Cladophialophora psammophila CBS 110553]|uniref:Uncharacterized protein n=1 Tax=Cladophialophora psammophila CBS 110553 TaxID=1182543 RepID=W9WP39_9EURO|nr:uncharacterized protein A1O5_07010 [Cladophialophora psammophila CBS 110553]EXJ69937.1 hypothetical protein A1O5_07010 [Cladophialophora psammophila CBS 110553]
MSAQVAYDHACAASALVDAVLSTFARLSAIPSFVAYAAYCGAAIQIPFMWSTEPAVKQRAYENVRANVKMIYTLAKYWKFAALLESHVRYIYQIHAKSPVILENEPKLIIDSKKLMSFRGTTAVHARESILGHNRILWRNGNVLPRPGEEVADLGAEGGEGEGQGGRRGESLTDPPPSAVEIPRRREISEPQSQSTLSLLPEPAAAPLAQQTQPPPPIPGVSLPMQVPLPLSSPYAPPPPPPLPIIEQTPGLELPSLDFFRPFHDPEMLDLFPNGQAMDFSLFAPSPGAGLGFLDPWPATIPE